MVKSGSISSEFLINSFLGFAFVVLMGGTLSVLFAINIADNIINASISQPLVILIVFGIICLTLMPYSFRVARSIRFLDISSSDPKNMKFTIHAPVYANEVGNPDEIDIKQIRTITRDRIFSNLMKFNYEHDGQQKTIISFIKKENVDFIRNLPKYQSQLDID